MIICISGDEVFQAQMLNLKSLSEHPLFSHSVGFYYVCNSLIFFLFWPVCNFKFGSLINWDKGLVVVP